jgi:hypothetical protein
MVSRRQAGLASFWRTRVISVVRPTKPVKRGRQVVARPAQRGADAGVECGRLFGWFGVEGGAHHAAALLILGHGRRVLAGARQRQHQLAIAFLAPAVEGQQPVAASMAAV